MSGPSKKAIDYLTRLYGEGRGYLRTTNGNQRQSIGCQFPIMVANGNLTVVPSTPCLFKPAVNSISAPMSWTSDSLHLFPTDTRPPDIRSWLLSIKCSLMVKSLEPCLQESGVKHCWSASRLTCWSSCLVDLLFICSCTYWHISLSPWHLLALFCQPLRLSLADQSVTTRNRAQTQ